MPIVGYLTRMLKPEYQERGYELTEDDHCLYLHLDGKIVGIFNALRTTIEDVERHIETLKEDS